MAYKATYKPIRDRGVYRAAANKNSINHQWALRLVQELDRGFSGLLWWFYRQKGERDIMAELIYDKNPFLSFLKK